MKYGIFLLAFMAYLMGTALAVPLNTTATNSISFNTTTSFGPNNVSRTQSHEL